MISAKVLAIFIFNVVFFVQLTNAQHSDWNHNQNDENGPPNWGRINANCDGVIQSPININFNQSVWSTYQLTFNNFDVRPTEVIMTNTGHDFTLIPIFPLNRLASIQFGPQNGVRETYIVDSVHIHWGETDVDGSEHSFNGDRYPAEMHIVCYDVRHGSLQRAMTIPGGLAVIGTFFVVNRNQAPRDLDGVISGNWARLSTPNRYLDSVPFIYDAGARVSQVNPATFTLMEVIKMLPSHYYSYRGSLTTPNCYQSVIWIVNRQPILILPLHMHFLRQMRNRQSQRILRNSRPAQPVNNRITTRNTQN